MNSRKDQVGGTHYAKHDIQPFDVYYEYMTPSEIRGALWSNVLKYSMRWREKGGVEDLYKLKDYLERLIGHQERESVRKAEEAIPDVRSKVEAGEAGQGRTGGCWP